MFNLNLFLFIATRLKSVNSFSTIYRLYLGKFSKLFFLLQHYKEQDDLTYMIGHIFTQQGTLCSDIVPLHNPLTKVATKSWASI